MSTNEHLWRSVDRIPAGQGLELIDLQVYRGLFPADVCRGLHEHILSQPSRKITHYPDAPTSSVPTQITRALSCLPFLGKGNTVITKRYESAEGSDAFMVHRDPEKFACDPLVLCSLGGPPVTLSVIFDDRRLIEVECTPNTAVVAHNNPMHAVTPPNGVRTFMFSGTDASHPNLLSQWDAFLTSRTTN